MSLRTVNLNLLPILRALLRTCSVSQAADLLGLSQGAASNALSRLRATFEDELLVRVGSKMELTPRAVDLMEPTETLCASLEDFFSRPRFNAPELDRTFTVATSDYATFLIAAPLLTTIERIAPNARLRFVDVIDRLGERMGDREVDIAIVPENFISMMAPAKFKSVRLLSETAVAVVAHDHPLAGRAEVGDEDLAAYRPIAFHPNSERIERLIPHAFMAGHVFAPAAFVPQVTAALHMLPGTTYFSIAPLRVARRMASILPLSICALENTSSVLHIALVWSAVHDADPAHRWLRDRTIEVAAALA